MNLFHLAAAAVVALTLSIMGAQAQTQPRNKSEEVIMTSVGTFTLCSSAGWHPTQCAGVVVPDPGDKQLSGLMKHVIVTPAGTLVKTNPQWSEMGFPVALFETDSQIFLVTILNYGNMGTVWRYDAQNDAFNPLLITGLMLSVKGPYEGTWQHRGTTRLELSYYGGSRDGKSAGHLEYEMVAKTWVEHSK